MDEQDESDAQSSVKEGSAGEVDQRAKRNLAVHLGVQAGRPGDQAGDNQGQNHQLQDAHEELPGIRNQHDGVPVQVQRSQRESFGHERVLKC